MRTQKHDGRMILRVLSVLAGPAARYPHISKAAASDIWVMPLLASPAKTSRVYRMARFTLLLFVFVIILIPSNVSAKETNFSKGRMERAARIEPPASTLTVGERLVFDVSWMGVPVGIGTLEIKEKVVRNGREAFHVIAIAETNEFLSKIYPIHDEVHSFIDAKEFYSLEFSKKLMEGRYRADERIVYDPIEQVAHYESLRSQTKKEIRIPPKVHDFLSAFFWFRLQPIRIGQTLHTLVNSEEENWDLELNILGVETKQFRNRGSMETIAVEPKSRLKGILYKRGRAVVYFTTDQRRLPVWISIKTPFGPVVGVLKPIDTVNKRVLKSKT